MKIRMGFVSNSSSSSFCIYGVCLDLDQDLKEIINRAYSEEYKKYNEEYKIDTEKVSKYGLIEFLESVISKDGLELHRYSDYDYIYIGRSWTSIKGDETGNQFEKDVEDKIEKILGKKTKCCICEESWYNG